MKALIWTGDMVRKFIKVYIYTSWLPLAAYVAALCFLGSLDGWSAWASGKVIIPSLLLSVLYSVIGLFIFFTSMKLIDNIRVFVGAIIISSSIMLWFYKLPEMTG